MSALPCGPPKSRHALQPSDPRATTSSHRFQPPYFQSPASTLVKILVKTPPPRLTSSIPVTYPVSMADPQRATRAKPRISYEISSESEDDDSSVPDSPFSSPERPTERRPNVVDLENDEESEEDNSRYTPPMRTSSTGHSLRQRTELNQPLRARENGDRRRISKQKKSKNSSRTVKGKQTFTASTGQKTERTDIRHQISTVTAGKRANFFVAKKDMFMPLLPESNYIQRLVDQRRIASLGGKDSSVPYKDIKEQPVG